MKTINRESYTVKNKEVINFLSEDGGDSASRTSCCSFLYPSNAGKLLDGTGILTYNRAAEVYSTRFSGKGGKKRKPLCNDTYLYYSDKEDFYYVEYESIRLLTIHRHGWTLFLPKYSKILYPGYCSRVKYYTGLSLFKTNRNIICLGSLRYPASKFRKNESIFIDYSFLYKNPHFMQYHSARTSVSEINKRKHTRISWCRDMQIEYGRNFAISGTIPRATVLLKSVIRSYVKQYLSSYCLNSSKLSFSDFCSKEIVNYSSAPHAMNKADRCWPLPSGVSSYLEFPTIYDIDRLYDSATAGSDGLRIAKYGLLAQAMFCMRGLCWIPGNAEGKKHLEKQNPGDYLAHPYVDKYSFSSYENFNRYYGDGSMHNSNRKNMTSDLVNELGCRRGLLEQFLQYLLCTSKGGHPKVREHNRSDLVQRSDRHRGYDRDNNLVSQEGMSLSYVADIFLSMVAEENDRTGGRWNKYYGTQHYTTMVTRSIACQHRRKTELDTRVLYKDMDNPFPRLFFFVMLDEYISTGLLGKKAIVSLLNNEWSAIADKPVGEYDLETEMPISFDIMHSFLSKRLHGIFLPLVSGPTGVSGSSWHDNQHLIAYGTIDTSRGWYGRDSDTNYDPVPSELNHPWETMQH